MTRFTPSASDRESDESQGKELATRSSGWGLLAAEVFDDEDRILVRLEAPGLEKDDIALEVVDNYLVVRGEKQTARERTEGRYHVSVRWSSSESSRRSTLHPIQSMSG